MTKIKIKDIIPFKNHPFKIDEDDSLKELMESIDTTGLINPVIVRKKSDKYEMISGHRRLKACELLGKEEIEANIRELTDDEATILMVDSNMQRDKILPSEKAFAYTKWLTQKDGKNIYRLPTEAEWELAAGHMPKDADFNNGTNSRTSVYKYDGITRGAHGAIDFWGNVWEWTSTTRSNNEYAVKGGSYKSERTECRTEHRKEQRNKNNGYDDVGFRVIQVKDGKEPEETVELTTLPSTKVTAQSKSNSEINLYWDNVEGTTEYQIFTYDKENNLVTMLGTTKSTSITIYDLESKTEYGFIVQPISNTNIGDNVSKDYAVYATTK